MENWRTHHLSQGQDGSFGLLHGDDLSSDPASLRRVPSPKELRELIRLDCDGKFRSLRAAPNLVRGWIHYASDLASLQLALEYFYPAALVNWMLWRHQALPTTAWRETAERQSGRFHVVRELDDTAIREEVTQICDSGCLKRRLWSPAIQATDGASNEIPLLCPEACNFLVAKARGEAEGRRGR